MDISVLIVDDWAVMRKLIIDALEETDYRLERIIEATDGINALEKIEKSSYLNLILVDWNMPHMDGLEFVKKLREKNKVIATVMITTESNISKMDEALEIGVDSYVTKPFTAKDLQRKIKQAIQRSAMR